MARGCAALTSPRGRGERPAAPGPVTPRLRGGAGMRPRADEMAFLVRELGM